MKREQRNKAIQRLKVLDIRMKALGEILNTELSSPFYRTQCHQIIDETKVEYAVLEKLLATRIEFLFNFIGGGWTSEYAYTEEEAIEQAIKKHGSPTDNNTVSKINTTTFRTSTPADYNNLISMFY